jgi:hypothetical protein
MLDRHYLREKKRKREKRGEILNKRKRKKYKKGK